MNWTAAAAPSGAGEDLRGALAGALLPSLVAALNVATCGCVVATLCWQRERRRCRSEAKAVEAPGRPGTDGGSQRHRGGAARAAAAERPPTPTLDSAERGLAGRAVRPLAATDACEKPCDENTPLACEQKAMRLTPSACGMRAPRICDLDACQDFSDERSTEATERSGESREHGPPEGPAAQRGTTPQQRRDASRSVRPLSAVDACPDVCDENTPLSSGPHSVCGQKTVGLTPSSYGRGMRHFDELDTYEDLLHERSVGSLDTSERQTEKISSL